MQIEGIMHQTKQPCSRFVKSVSRMLWDTDLIATRITLALGEFFWAVMLLWPGDTFDRPTYAHMAMVANEELWGVVFLISCITQITIVLLDDLHSRFARYFAGWNAVLWTYTVISMMISIYPPPAAVGGEIALGFAAMWIWVRPYLLAEGYKHVIRTR